MKTVYKVVFYSLLSGVLSACVGNSEPLEQVVLEKQLTFIASAEQFGAGTKTVRNDDGSTWWNPAEEISVFYGSGSGGGALFRSTNTEQAATVEFSGSVQMTGSGKSFWAVYPYSDSNSCDGESVTTIIPSEQTASQWNFSNDAFPAIAESKTLDLAFWNICGGIKFYVSRNDICSVTFAGNNDEPLAGKVKVGLAEDGKPYIKEYLDVETEVTLTAPEGETFKVGRYYYVSLLPGALSYGFNMTFTTANSEGTFVSDKAQEIKRSVFGVLKGIDNAVSVWRTVTPSLTSLSFNANQYFEGIGVISAYEIYAPRTTSAKRYPTLDKRYEGSFVTSSPIVVAYKTNPLNIEIHDYDWYFVNRSVYTKASSDYKTDLVSVIAGPEKKGDYLYFVIKLNRTVSPLQSGSNNDVIALCAESKVAGVNGEKERIISDLAYIDKRTTHDFYIVHKDREFLYRDVSGKDVVYEYDPDDPKYYRWESFVAIGDPADYNNIPIPSETGIATPVPGLGNNPKAISLPYDGSVDLLDYVETYSLETKDIVSTLGIEPTYTFQFAGLNEATREFLSGSDPDRVVYLAEDVNKTNQNKFIKFEGSKISVNDEFVGLLSSAIGRTPLIYVQSKVGGAVLAECLIKIAITGEAAPEPQSKGWDVFIWNDAKFKYDDLYTPSFMGYEGTASAPRQNITVDDKDIRASWNEVNPWVLNDAYVNMSYEYFAQAYDLGAPKLILTRDSKEPGATLPERETAVLVDPADINTYYSASGSGLTITSMSPSNWKQSTGVAYLSIDNTFKALNAGKDVHYVYVVYPAVDNTKNIDVVFKFSFTVEPHMHDWTILKKYNDKTFWTLNPDYILGTQDLLIEPKPAADAYYGNEPYKTYGAVSVTGPETNLRSSLVEHFKENANCWKSANEESDYIFKICNYTKDVVDIINHGTGVVKYEDNYATITLSGTELKKIAVGNAVSPDILVNKPAGLSAGSDVLVQVTELCRNDAYGIAVKDLRSYDYGKTYVQAYYYVVFEAIRDGSNLASDGETANCYIVSEPGSYKFPMVAGNESDEVLSGVTRVGVLWETANTATAPAVGDIVKDVTFNGRFVYFNTPSSLKDGNAVIAAYKGNDIVWSWHIWVCSGYNPDATAQTLYGKTRPMMDRNLGALSSSSSSALANGLFYQWGRKDPFPGALESYVSADDGAGTFWATTAGALKKQVATGVTVDYVVAHPDEFITSTDGYWLPVAINSLWGITVSNAVETAVKSVYDPCPPGWKVPRARVMSGTQHNVSEEAWAGLDNNARRVSTGLYLSTTVSGVEAWYPNNGYIDRNGNVIMVGQYACYWSCSFYGSGMSFVLQLSRDMSGKLIWNPMQYGKLNGEGHSVRCIKDN